MSSIDCLVDTNILIYHTQGASPATDLVDYLLSRNAFHVSILTKVEFLGWNKHTLIGFEKCKALIESATMHSVDERIADHAIEIRRLSNMKLADAIIAATALANRLKLATRNIDDFRHVADLSLINPFDD